MAGGCGASGDGVVIVIVVVVLFFCFFVFFFSLFLCCVVVAKLEWWLWPLVEVAMAIGEGGCGVYFLLFYSVVYVILLC